MEKTKKETPKDKATGKKKQDNFIDAISASPGNGGKGKSVTIEHGKLLKLNKRLEQAEFLLEMTREIAGFESLSEVLNRLIEITAKELDCERSTLFLNDEQTGELYSRVALGDLEREIRVLNDNGVAGYVFTHEESLTIHDAKADPRHDQSIDEETGFDTKNILSVPVRTMAGQVIGVLQALNKNKGRFTKEDLNLLETLSSQASVTLAGTQQVERIRKKRAQEMEFLDTVATITAEVDLNKLLENVVGEITRMLDADRSTLFINDPKTNELFSRVAGGDGVGEIRLPNHVGIAGSVFTSGETLNIPHAYADLRFNPGFDKKIGYFTQSVLCCPITTKEGEIIGVSQVLNKKGGPFTDEDESRLRAFTTQVAISLENSKLFDDVQNMKNYSDGMLQSMSNGVITLDEEGTIVTCNAAGLKIMSVTEEEIIGLTGKEHFIDKNSWVMDQVEEVLKTQESEITMDAELSFGEEKISANTSVLPLSDPEGKHLGTLIMIEDISSEKRMKSTMSRYMDPGIADQLLAGGDDVLGGQDLVATLLFSDIRGFTTLTEALGAQGTVKLLNDYFTIMVDCISKEEGMLDKFIGDAIMAAFGVPISHDDDEDRAMRAAITMLTSLEDWNTERKKQGQLPVYMGIGLNTDKIVSGNIGSPKRMDFTMIGDGVNLAARLESACKAYSAKLLISEYTVAKLKGTYQIRDVDNIIVKGKTEPVGVFEVLDYHTDDSFPNLMESVNHFKEARKHYRAGSWDKSIKSFKECLKLNPNDALSQTYVDRIAGLKKNPPKNWDGVLTMTSK